MKYLGVTLQRRLSWKLHCKERIAKATRTINLANAAIGQKWGFNPERALWVYTAMARSVATYGAVVWSTDVTTEIGNMLQKLQRKAMLSMTSSMRSTPSKGMEVVLGLLPLDLQALQQGTSARWRTRRILSKRWDGLGKTRKGHQRKLDDVLREIPLTGSESDWQIQERVWLSNDEHLDQDLTLYTDGSKLEGRAGAGWAACVGDTSIHEESIGLGEDNTVFQAEVFAIERGLLWAIENCDEGTSILIRSDSQSAIQAVFKPTSTSKTVSRCKEVLRTAKENLRIGIKWVKGHADHTGNELADYLASQKWSE